MTYPHQDGCGRVAAGTSPAPCPTPVAPFARVCASSRTSWGCYNPVKTWCIQFCISTNSTAVTGNLATPLQAQGQRGKDGRAAERQEQQKRDRIIAQAIATEIQLPETREAGQHGTEYSAANIAKVVVCKVYVLHTAHRWVTEESHKRGIGFVPQVLALRMVPQQDRGVSVLGRRLHLTLHVRASRRNNGGCGGERKVGVWLCVTGGRRP